jgi:hypothetical protein
MITKLIILLQKDFFDCVVVTNRGDKKLVAKHIAKATDVTISHLLLHNRRRKSMLRSMLQSMLRSDRRREAPTTDHITVDVFYNLRIIRGFSKTSQGHKP